MVRVEQEHAQQRSTRPKRLTSVTNENILIQAKQDYLDGLLDLKDYQQRLRSLGYRYINVFDTFDKDDLDYEPQQNVLKYGYFQLQRAQKSYLDSCFASKKIDLHLIKRFIEIQVILLAPICPHICDHVYQFLHPEKSIMNAKWPIPEQIVNNNYNLDDGECNITYSTIATAALSTCHFYLIVGLLNEKQFAYLLHTSLGYGSLNGSTTIAKEIVKNIIQDIVRDINFLHQYRPVEHKDKIEISNMNHLKMLIDGGATLEQDSIQEALLLLNDDQSNIRIQTLLEQDDEKLLVQKLYKAVKVLSPITFLLDDINEEHAFWREKQNAQDINLYSSNTLREITNNGLNNELATAGDKLVIVNFFATWCDSCKNIVPHIEQLSGLYLNNVFLNVDIEKCMNEVLRYSINIIPTFLFIQHGEEVDRLEFFDEEYTEKTIKKFSNDTSSKDIKYSTFSKAIAVGNLVKSALGPKGMDKILRCNMSGGLDADKLLITNNRTMILSKIGVDNPVVKDLVDISKVQYDEVGDGSKSVVVLASELLRETENLLAQKIHLQTIITGWRKATNEALTVLEGVAKNNSSNLEQFKSDLMNIARTTLSSKILQEKKDHLSKLCFLLGERIGTNMPKRIENARILIANIPMDTDKRKVSDSSVHIDSIAKLVQLELAKNEKIKDKVEKILQFSCNLFINRQLICDYANQLFAEKGVMTIEHADFEGLKRLAQILDADIVSTLDTPDEIRLGKCILIEEVIVNEDKLIKLSGVTQGEACTIVLHGATQQILDEAERSIHGALCVLSQTVKEPRICYGEGAAETLMATAVSQLAEKTSGEESVVIESFAHALRQLPTIIADNAGYDSAILIDNLRTAHALGKSAFGLDMEKGVTCDMVELGILEPFYLKQQVVIKAAKAVEMILCLDNII
ncbi:unnamed protein product [Rotaria sordida]|uniref:Thioredoxin domain-containing protein n=1 Tax=Rotaria sordida TaxID=392033 RepID=A0A815RZU5_9BILA|nr:unnamed protein product [Rotaria sordida]